MTLTAEQDKEKLLIMVLDAAMAAAGCDAETLYLLEGDNLVFSRMEKISRGIRLGGHMGPPRRMNAAECQGEKDLRWVEIMSRQTFTDEKGVAKPVITAKDAKCLRIRSGTLTAGERHAMEAHVTETARILNRVRFPEEYREIPAWAAAHHEYLDGTGYPEHPPAKRIPTEVRLMTIHSLDASDRPYKKERTPEEAPGILRSMTEEGKLDAGILDIFEAGRDWEDHQEYNKNPGIRENGKRTGT